MYILRFAIEWHPCENCTSWTWPTFRRSNVVIDPFPVVKAHTHVTSASTVLRVAPLPDKITKNSRLQFKCDECKFECDEGDICIKSNSQLNLSHSYAPPKDLLPTVSHLSIFFTSLHYLWGRCYVYFLILLVILTVNVNRNPIVNNEKNWHTLHFAVYQCLPFPFLSKMQITIKLVISEDLHPIVRHTPSKCSCTIKQS